MIVLDESNGESVVARSRKDDDEEPRRKKPQDDDEKPKKRAKAKNDDEDDGDEEDDGPVMPRKKKKSAKNSVKKVFSGIGITIGFKLLILLLYWIYSPIGTDHRMLCYCPPETSSLMGYDVGDNNANPKMKDVHDFFVGNYMRNNDKRFTTATGLTQKEVERYLSGVASGDPQEEEKEPDPQNKRGSFTILRFKQDLDKKKFIDSFVGQYECREESSPDGKTFYRLFEKLPNELRPDVSFFFPNDRTLMYTSTRRELTEALKRQPGKIELDGPMRDLAEKVDGQYFSANKFSTAVLANMYSPRFAFTGGFIDSNFREGKTFISSGSATWFGSNGNDFLYANGELYADWKMAREVRIMLEEGYASAQKAAYSDGGQPSGVQDIFFPKQAVQTGGFTSEGTKEGKQAAADSMVEYVKSYKVSRHGNMVSVSGMISHENFDKLWKAINGKFAPQQSFGGPGMMFPPRP